MADEATENAAAAESTENTAEGQPNATFDEVVTAVKALIAHGQKQEQAINSITANMAEISNRPPQSAPPQQIMEHPAEVKDIETMTRAEYADYLVGRVNKELVQPIATASEDTKREQTSAELKEISERYVDFWDFKDEVKDVITKSPNIGIEEAYFIARGKNRDKAVAIDTKIAETKSANAQKEADQEKEDKRAGFGGLLPTSGQTSKAATLTAKDAANAAWEETGMTEHLASITN